MHENIHRFWKMKILNMTKNNKKMELGKDEGTCWTRWTVGARKTQTPLPGLVMRCLNSYMSSTAMCVLPHPVSKYTMMFSSIALLQSSNWYLQNPKSPTQPNQRTPPNEEDEDDENKRFVLKKKNLRAIFLGSLVWLVSDRAAELGAACSWAMGGASGEVSQRRTEE